MGQKRVGPSTESGKRRKTEDTENRVHHSGRHTVGQKRLGPSAKSRKRTSGKLVTGSTLNRVHHSGRYRGTLELLKFSVNSVDSWAMQLVFTNQNPIHLAHRQRHRV